MQYSVRKRVAALVLAFSVLICSFVSSVNVQAMDMSEWEDFIAEFGVTTTVVKFIMTEIFKLAVGDLDGMIQDSLAMQDYIIAMQEKYGSQSGTLEIEEADLKELYEIAKDSIKAMDGYYLVEPTFTADGFIFQSGNDVSDVSAIDHYRNLFLEKKYIFSRLNSNTVWAYSDESAIEYLYINYYGVLGYDPNNDKSFNLQDYKFPKKSPGSNYNVLSSVGSLDGFISASDFPIKVFYSKSDLVRYINVGPNIYVGSDFKTPNGSLSVNLEQILEKDWDSINGNVYDAILNEITNQGGWSSLDEQQRQEIVDATILEILGSLGEIGDSTGEAASLLASIKGILEKILDKMDDLKGSVGGGAAGSFLGTVFGNLLSNLVDSIMNGDETVENVVTDLTSRFSNVSELSKTKFPFSLPWDLVAVFTVLAHEPETPVFEFPIVIESIGFSYTIKLDFTEFEALSKTSRSFFVLIFCLLLIRLTLQMTYRGDFE